MFSNKTRFIVWLSIILSGASYFIGQEIYPFFYWKLYTQPTGANMNLSIGRVYALNEASDTVRISNLDSKVFNETDYVYYTQYLLKNYNKNKTNANCLAFQSFAETVAPGFSSYLFIEEKYEISMNGKLSLLYKNELTLCGKH